MKIIKPRLVGVFAFCEMDEHYVQGLKDSMPYVDKWISYDDRGNTEYYFHEGNVRNQLIAQATELGARWIIGCDPDERYERRAEKIIPYLLDLNERVSYSMCVREMYTHSEYRVDGIWGRKRQTRLFPVVKGAQYMSRPVHSYWNPIGVPVKRTAINLYHFKMINPEKRVERANIYNKVDKDHLQDYNYLTDETNIQLQAISHGREYRSDPSLFQPAVLHSRGD